MADTTQPAGALPEPVHFRALLADDQRPQQLNTAMHVCGFRDRRTAENWVASKLDFDHWRYALEPLYAEDDLRAMMAERDAARDERDAALERAEFCLAFTRDAQALCATAQAEAAALRREMEELRAIPPDAREGREPPWRPIATAPKDMASYLFLCSGVAMQGFRDATGELCVCQEEGTKRWRSMRRKPTHWMALPIGPAGTSAEGADHG